MMEPSREVALCVLADIAAKVMLLGHQEEVLQEVTIICVTVPINKPFAYREENGR